MRARGRSGMRAGMMEVEMDAMPSEISPSLMMKSSSGGRKFVPSQPKVILRSLFPETWLFDLVDVGEMPLRFLPFAVTDFVRQILSQIVAIHLKLFWLSIGKPPF